MSLRLQNIMADFGNPDTYGISNPFGAPPDASFQSAPPQSNYAPEASFAPQTQNSVFQAQSQGRDHPAVTDAYSRLKAIFDSYTPETQSTDRLNNLLDNMPQMNKPSFARKLAATGAAIGNIGPGFTHSGTADAADRVLYAPYLQQMAAFKEKTGPFQAAATAENARNIQERTLSSNMLTAQMQADKLAESGRQADDKAEITRQRNAVLASKDLGFTYTKDGDTLIGHRPDGTTFVAGQASNFNALELETLRQQGRMAVQGSRNEGNLNVAQQQGTNQMNVQGAITDRVNDPNRPGKANTPSQVATDRKNKAQAILANNPSLAPYLRIENNQVIMTPPKASWGGMGSIDPNVQKAFDDAKTAIFGSQSLSGVNMGNLGQTSQGQNTQPQYKYQADQNDPKEMRRTSDGKTFQYSHDGGKTWGVQ